MVVWPQILGASLPAPATNVTIFLPGIRRQKDTKDLSCCQIEYVRLVFEVRHPKQV